jgi:hypothetical protein
MHKQPLSNSTAKTSMAVLSQLTKPVPAKTVLQAVVVVAADALMALAATSVAVAVVVVVMTAVAVAVAVDAATSVVVNSSR